MKDSKYLNALRDITIDAFRILAAGLPGRLQPDPREIWRVEYELHAKTYGLSKSETDQFGAICESWYSCCLSDEFGDNR